MASADITIAITEELKTTLDALREEMKAAKEALSEERIRAIVREELNAVFSGMGKHNDLDILPCQEVAQ